MELLDIPILPIAGEFKDEHFPAPEELTYWEARKARTFYIDYELDDNYSLIELSKVIIQMNMLEKDIPAEDLKPIYIWIHSYGGDLDQATMFCDLCEASRIPIITIGMGVAMSAGFLIFLSGKRRYAFKHCQMLVHSGGASLQGTAEQIEEFQKNYKKQLNEMKAFILARTDIDEKTFNKNRNKDWYLTADDLVNYHVVDKLIDNIEDIF